MVNIETASESDICMVKQRYVNCHRFIQIRLINTYIWYKWSWCKTMYWIHRSWFRSIKQIMKDIWYYIDSWSFALESDISMVKQWHVNQSYRISVIKGFDGTKFCIRIREKLGFSHGPARGADGRTKIGSLLCTCAGRRTSARGADRSSNFARSPKF